MKTLISPIGPPSTAPMIALPMAIMGSVGLRAGPLEGVLSGSHPTGLLLRKIFSWEPPGAYGCLLLILLQRVSNHSLRTRSALVCKGQYITAVTSVGCQVLIFSLLDGKAWGSQGGARMGSVDRLPQQLLTNQHGCKHANSVIRTRRKHTQDL